MKKRLAPPAGEAGFGVEGCIFDSCLSGGPSVACELERGNAKNRKLITAERLGVHNSVLMLVGRKVAAGFDVGQESENLLLRQLVEQSHRHWGGVLWLLRLDIRLL